MKTKNKLYYSLCLIIGLMCTINNVRAQYCGPYGGNRFEIQTTTVDPYLALTIGSGTCLGAGSLTFPGMGINITSPQYMLDILCDPSNSTKSDINVSNTGSAQTVGYRIGGQRVLWYNGDISNIYTGVGAGNVSGGLNNVATGYDALHFNTSDANTADGYMALSTNVGGGGGNTAIGSDALAATNGGAWNTAVGWGALMQNVTGGENTALGVSALSKNIADDNTAVGYAALLSNTSGGSNTAVGWNALQANVIGSSNTATGQQALYINTTGSNNTATGYEVLNNNQTGSNNTAMGVGALNQTNIDNNTAIGYQSLFHNVTGTHNIAIGVNALYYNIGYSASIAIGDSALYNQTGTSSFNSGNVAVGNSTLFAGTSADNTAIGEWAMRHNINGDENTAVGYAALYSNTMGTPNTAIGYEAMFLNITGVENTALGTRALYSNTAGGDNTAIGEGALYLNNGLGNTATGESALGANIRGAYNTAIGTSSLGGSTGSSNSAIGVWAGLNNAGSLNTFLGDSAGFACSSNTFNNDVFVGYMSGPLSPSAITSNVVYLGNQSTSAIEAVSAISITSWSDRRVKDSIQANVPGLAFINKLQPVTFHYSISKEYQLFGLQDSTQWANKYDVEKITQSGFIAQQVDSAAKACKYNFSGVTCPQGPNQPYKLGYTTFVVPLVKAVQELNAKNDTLRSTVDSLRSLHTTVDSLRTVLKNIQNCLNQLCNTSGEDGITAPHNNGANSSNDENTANNIQNITLSSSTGTPLLYQNTPNPFSTGTKINYYLPEGTLGATIVFYDTYGNLIKTVQLSQTGNGTLNITPDNLSNGIYSYSLIVNGSIIDTKKMLLQK